MLWDRLRRITAPAVQVVTLAEAKDHLKIEFDDHDALITALIDAATSQVDGAAGIGSALITQTWRLSFDYWPSSPIQIPLGPVQSVTSITYVDGSGATQTWSPAGYQVDVDGAVARIVPAYSTTWPVARLQPGAIKITFVAGYGPSANDVPADLKAAIKLLIGHLFANREAASDKAIAALPFGVEAILNRYRSGLVA